MDTGKKIASIRKDISNGLKSKAMNRLQGLINAYPDDLVFRKELGRLYLSVDWKEKAGLYFLLCETKNKEEENIIECYMGSINNSGYKALVDLKFKGNRDLLPSKTLERLVALEAKSIKEMNIIPKYKHKPSNKIKRANIIKESWKTRLGLYVVIFMLASIPVLAIIGIIQVVKWVW